MNSISLESMYYKVYVCRNHFQCNLCVFNANSIILQRVVSVHVFEYFSVRKPTTVIANDKLYYGLILDIVKCRRS